jgi:hypothetical protein
VQAEFLSSLFISGALWKDAGMQNMAQGDGRNAFPRFFIFFA